jgi:uncharacterized damage-inducible protein DinB
MESADAVTPLSKLIDHSVWANENCVDFLAEGFASDEFLMKRMAHILLGERAWFQRLSGDEPDRDIWKRMTVSELRGMHARHRTMYDELLRGNLQRVIAYKRFTGEACQSQVADILLHLTLHGAHHRGQMATYLSGKGTKPINTDFLQFCLAHGV